MKVLSGQIIVLSFVLLLSQLFIAQSACAQFSIEDYKEDAIGWGLWYGIGSITLDAPNKSASNKTKGYIDVLPSESEGRGFAVGISYGHFGINYGQDTGEVKINKYADIQQNSITSDDVYVYKARRINRSIAILFQPLRYLFLGVGQDIGHVEFEQRSPSGDRETKKIAFRYNFYSCGFAIGFDPTKNALAPIFTLYTKIPQSRSDYSGTVVGMGAGLYF